MQDGAICYVEFFTTDLERSRFFYESAFGWRFHAREGWDAFLFFETPDGVGGMFKAKPEAITQLGPIVHVQSSDIGAMLQRVVAAGGKIVMAKTAKSADDPSQGHFALVEDDVGNRIGLST
ncbi:VOC family protein [Candidatus Bipolaricaulota bacterium]